MFKIEETLDPYCHVHAMTSLEVENLRDLPAALKRLAELGHNMEPSLEALQEAVEDQRKQKVLQAAINAIAADQVKKQ